MRDGRAASPFAAVRDVAWRTAGRCEVRLREIVSRVGQEMGVKELEYPFTEEKVRALRTGDMVRVSGRLYTGRDRLHKYVHDGGRLPVSLENAAIYHCGPVMVRRDGVWRVKAAGPTTSIREEPYAAGLIEQGLRVIIGKGGMGENTRRACAAHGAVYLQAVGGAAALLGRCIERVSAVHFLKEFGAAEALWELDVRGMEAVVAIDSEGRSLHKRIRNASKRALNALLK